MTTAADSPLRYTIGFVPCGSRAERQALHHFNTFVVSDVSGFTVLDFWRRTIPQRCQYAAPLLHATVALGQLYAEYLATSRDDRFTPSKTSHCSYGKAITSLRAYIDGKGDLSRSLILMCCAVLVCCDLVSGERDAAFIHLDTGLKLLIQTQSAEEGISRDGDAHAIAIVFARMDLEATLLDETRPLVLKSAKPEPLRPARLHPACGEFLPLARLYDYQFALTYETLVFAVESARYKLCSACSVPLAVQDRRSQLLHEFETWDSSIAAHEQLFDAEDMAAWQWKLTSARLHKGITKLLLQHSLDDDIKASAPSWDEGAEKVLLAARARMQPVQKAFTGQRSIHDGIAGPLATLLAVMVLSPHLREQAFSLVRALQRLGEIGAKEGLGKLKEMACLRGLQNDPRTFPILASQCIFGSGDGSGRW